ncbi:hypothetical protein [Roseateles terrae]|uniref:Uncharacterized protein n=1 Tax=Roseateles terrae TaxID=431060 RepID=A0ABR6GS07_9BURK|nr:hypothetical protein [Roseateles terrae]MBB3194009.1 hypothetical protein [Roseateles terrae]OWQ87884.1 hypothetical protein CDN98_06895 [Roseateles terrae]
MFYAIGWFIVAMLLALWSLATWTLHAVAVWAVSQAGVLSGMAGGAVSVSLPAWLEPWVPTAVTQALTTWMTQLGPMLESLLQSVPALAGGLTVLAWVVWALGTVLLLLVGAGLHALTAWGRKKAAAASLAASTSAARNREAGATT